MRALRFEVSSENNQRVMTVISHLETIFSTLYTGINVAYGMNEARQGSMVDVSIEIPAVKGLLKAGAIKHTLAWFVKDLRGPDSSSTSQG